MKFLPIHFPRLHRRQEPPTEEMQELISTEITEDAALQQTQMQSIASAAEVSAAIETAKVELQKYTRPEPGRKAIEFDDVALISEELSLLQRTLQGIHSDEDVSELDRTLIHSFQDTLPYFFQFGEKEAWKNALSELKQAVGQRIGDADQIKAANVDLLILHCRAKDLYYDCMLYLTGQKLDSLREERKQLILNDASETAIKQIVSLIGTAENDADIYDRAKSANIVRMGELQEHKRLYEESRLFSDEMRRAVDKVIAENVGMMLGITEQVIFDTQTAEKTIANRDAVNAVIQNHLEDSAPTLSAAARKMDVAEQTQADMQQAAEPMLHAQ